jgi:hypothetical protein
VSVTHLPLYNALITKVNLPVRASQDTYRPLFAAAIESVLIVELPTFRIIEANPSAARRLQTTQAMLIGSPLHGAFHASAGCRLDHALAAAQATGSAAPVLVRTAGGLNRLLVKASLLRSPPDVYLLIRLSGPKADPDRRVVEHRQSAVLEAIEEGTVAFAVTDIQLRLEYANRAFIALLGSDSSNAWRGQFLTRWLHLSRLDNARLRNQILQHRAVTELRTILRSSRGSLRQVKAQAVAVQGGDFPCWGFTVTEADNLERAALL